MGGLYTSQNCLRTALLIGSGHGGCFNENGKFQKTIRKGPRDTENSKIGKNGSCIDFCSKNWVIYDRRININSNPQNQAWLEVCVTPESNFVFIYLFMYLFIIYWKRFLCSSCLFVIKLSLYIVYMRYIFEDDALFLLAIKT